MCDDPPRRITTRTIARLLAIVPILAAVALIGSRSAAASTPGAPVYVLPTTGVVDNVMASYIAEGVAKAERDGSPAIVIELDTPGGDLQATQHIVTSLLEATIPTIVWVAPAGARAASAGTFITLAANLAYMAPGTNIGAASPVDSNGNDIQGTLGQKVKNDAIAKIRSIAETRGRNVDWAVSTVDTARSSPASEAVSLGAVDGIAATLDEVRAKAQGRTVTVAAGVPVTVDLSGSSFSTLGMNPFQAFLHLLADPNIAFILFTLGFYGLLFELMSPNFVTGILGAFAIVLAFIGFGSLPLNIAGLLLICLGIILFVIDIGVTNHGLLTVGGLVAFLLGASALYTSPVGPLGPDVSVALPLVFTMGVLFSVFFGLIALAAVRSRRLAVSPALVGAPNTLVGEPGRVGRPLTPVGSVWAGGEEWTARSSGDEPIARGAPVRVVSRDGLTLVVEPVPEAPAGPGETGNAAATIGPTGLGRGSASALDLPSRPGPSQPQVQP